MSDITAPVSSANNASVVRSLDVTGNACAKEGITNKIAIKLKLNQRNKIWQGLVLLEGKELWLQFTLEIMNGSGIAIRLY